MQGGGGSSRAGEPIGRSTLIVDDDMNRLGVEHLAARKAHPTRMLMTPSTSANAVANASAEILWNPQSRVALVRYAAGAQLVGADGPFLVNALTVWIGERGEPFAVLADATGLHGTNAEYRASVSRFFKEHRDEAYVALVNARPVIHIVVEMFRIGTGVQLKAFADEAAARGWLRTKGIRA